MGSKRNLVILLLVPFVVSLLSFTIINYTFNLFDNDILSISWDYKDNELFSLTNEKYHYRLNASAVNDNNYPSNQELVWSVVNKNTEEEPHAEIIKYNHFSYLHTLSVGEVYISVSNDKGNIQKRMLATIYNGNAIKFNYKINGSQSNVDSNIYFGEYDLSNNRKLDATVYYDVEAITENNDSGIKVVDNSSNVVVNEKDNYFTIKGDGDGYITFGFSNPYYLDTFTTNFKVVKDGINVFTYNDLLYCTNKSNNGEIVVLRKNLESSRNMSQSDPTNTALFGNAVGDGYSFKNEVYQFKTDFNTTFIEDWNNFVNDVDGNGLPNSLRYNYVSYWLSAGIHVQKDFYGNGYTINLHNLAYPYSTIEIKGNVVPQLTDANLFRGPIQYYTLGDPNNSPLVTAYGQDNIGMYVEGDNITINDLKIKNCDFGNNLANLDYVGTVMEVKGNNVNIKNSVLSSGKNVLKVYDSYDVTVSNSIIEFARNFLFMTGSYKYEKVNDTREYPFVRLDGTRPYISVKNYLAPDAYGDEVLVQYLDPNAGPASAELLSSLTSIQNGLDSFKTQKMNGTTTLEDVLFYMSGISSIAFETLFNGPFLYNAAPSLVRRLIDQYSDSLDAFGLNIPLLPENVGGISYPVQVTLKGKTRFYDYKALDLLDINGLVGQNIFSKLEGTSYEGLSLDDIFPIKSILVEQGRKMGAIYNDDGKAYINVPIAYYGGGINYSEIIYDESFEYSQYLSDIFDVNFLNRYASISGLPDIFAMVLKAVTIVSGFNPFKFALSLGNGYLYNEAPELQQLINNYTE